MESVRDEVITHLCEARDFEQIHGVQGHMEAWRYSESDMVKELMIRLVDISSMHRALVDMLLASMIDCHGLSSFCGRSFVFNYERARDKEILEEVIWLKKKMTKHYQNILEILQSHDCSSFLSPEDMGKLKAVLNLLVEREQEQLRMAQETYSKLS